MNRALKTLLLIVYFVFFLCHPIVAAPIPTTGSPFWGVVVEDRVYVLNNKYLDPHIDVIDTKTNAFFTIPITQEFPIYAVTAGKYIVVNNNSSGTATIIDGITNTQVALVELPNYLCAPYYSTTWGTKIFVCNFHEQNISVINTTLLSGLDPNEASTQPIEATIDIGVINPLFCVTLGDKVFVNIAGSTSNMIVINARTNAVAAKIGLGMNSQGFSFVAGDKLYVQNSSTSAGAIVVVNTTLIDYTESPTTIQTDPVIATISTGINFTGQGARLVGKYLVGSSFGQPSQYGGICIIDTDSNTVTRTVTLFDIAPKLVVSGAFKNKVYVSSQYHNKLYVLDFDQIGGTDEEFVTTITGEGNAANGYGPFESTQLGNKLYLSNTRANVSQASISVLDMETDTFIDEATNFSSAKPKLLRFQRLPD